MLLYPSVDKLLEKVDSRYKLIALGAKRARELDAGMPATQETFKSNKSVVKRLKKLKMGTLLLTLISKTKFNLSRRQHGRISTIRTQKICRTSGDV